MKHLTRVVSALAMGVVITGVCSNSWQVAVIGLMVAVAALQFENIIENP